MSANVHDLWAGALPPGTQVAGGGAGLDREVRWVATLRPRAPGVVGLKGGELVLVSAESLRLLDERLTLARAIDRLAQAGVVAVAARGGIDSAAAARAEALDFPLLALPDETSLEETERVALRLLADRQAEATELAKQLREQLTELLIAGHDLPAIVDRLAVLTRRAVALEDTTGIRHLSGAARLADRELVCAALDRARPRLLAWIGGRPVPAADPPARRFKLGVDGVGRVVAPIAGGVGRAEAATSASSGPRRLAGASGDGALAFLSLIAPHETLGRADALSASHGATVCALVLARERAVRQAEDRLRRDVVTDLLAGSFPSEAVVHERAARLGFDLTAPHLPIALRAEAGGGRSRPADVVRALTRELARQGVAAPVGVAGGAVGVVYPLREGEPVALAQQVHQLAGRAVGGPVSAGVGRTGAGAQAIAEGYRQAERALAIAGRLFPPGRLTFFGDLGVHRLLLALDGHPELAAFYEETVAAIDQYDRANRSELAPTLEAFFAADNSLAETAARLHLHRNTVAYRLRRIEQISGHDLADAEVRLALHLGLRVRQALLAHEPNGRNGTAAPPAPRA
jgi:PucR family transcriptional regulator, purine catabolism regulatory protein